MRDSGSERVVQVFCQRLAVARKNSGFSVEGLAHVAGVSSATISHLENFNRSPRLLTVLKICRALEENPSDILRDLGV